MLIGEGSAHTVLCASFMPDGSTLLCGTMGGALLVWVGGRCEAVLQLNRLQPIYALHASEEGVFAAGKGGRLLLWRGARVALQLEEAQAETVVRGSAL